MMHKCPTYHIGLEQYRAGNWHHSDDAVSMLPIYCQRVIYCIACGGVTSLTVHKDTTT